MRPSRTALSLTVLASVPAALAFGLWGGSSSAAAPTVVTAHAAPVAIAPVHTAPAAARHRAPAKPARPAAKPTALATHTTTPKATHPAAPKGLKAPTAAASPAATHTAPRTAAVRTGTTTRNDYPYAAATTDTADKWGFTERQCVSFAAWRLARDGRAIDNAQGWGSALHWDETARARGVRVSSTPHVGAIAQWNAGEGGKVWVGGGVGTFTAGPYGHVGYVAAVYSDGSALIEQYNAQGDRAYSVMRMTAPRYLF